MEEDRKHYFEKVNFSKKVQAIIFRQKKNELENLRKWIAKGEALVGCLLEPQQQPDLICVCFKWKPVLNMEVITHT